MTSVGFEELSSGEKFQDLLLHMALAHGHIGAGEVAIIVRHVRASVLEVIGAPYVRAARGFGTKPARLLFRHVLPVAANPAISLLGFSLAGLLSGSLIVEVVCGWPGLGSLTLEATLSRDLYLVIGGLFSRRSLWSAKSDCGPFTGRSRPAHSK